jgi:ribonuclease HI
VRVDERGEIDRLLGFAPDTLSRQDLIDLVLALQSALRKTGQFQRSGVPERPRVPAKAVPGADYTVVFDGGSLGNPGLGYGSYEIAGPAGTVAARRLEFGPDMTNNQAEFRALIAGLEELLRLTGPESNTRSLAVRGDSQLVIRGLTGEWKVKHPGLQPLHRQASELLRRFAAVDLAWHPRRESVRTFGH